MIEPIKKLGLLLTLILVLGFSCAYAAVPAGGIKLARPAVTAAASIALLFYKLTGNFPDFSAWAQQSPDYMNAPPEKKIEVLDQKAKEFENTYSLMTLADPIIVEVPAKLSAYSALQKGFLIESFTANMYFGYEYMGSGYAVIPKSIADRQWLSVSSEQADAILSWTKEGKDAIVQISLLPVYADNKNPMPLNDTDHWLILAEIGNIALWSSDGSRLLWESRNSGGSSGANKLLGLYR